MKIDEFIICIIVLFNCSPCVSQIDQHVLEIKDTVFVSSEQIQISAEVGILRVPENRKNEQPRSITVNFVRLKSTAAIPKEPLLYLEGGGGSSTWQARNPEYLSRWIPILEVSDIILYDQRGSADEDLLWIWDGEYPKDFLVTEKAAGEHLKTMCIRGLKAFEERGVDIKGYTVVESAHDIDALRKALNIDKWSILGFSYGTHLGLTLIKLYEDRVVSAILAGVDGLDNSFNYPSDLDSHFAHIAELAKNDEEIPDLIGLLQRVMDKLDKEPIEVEIKNPLTELPLKVKVGPFGLALILMLDMDDASDIPVIPRLLYCLEQDDTSILKWFVQKRVVYAFAIPGNGLNQGIASITSKGRQRKIENEAKKSIFGNVINFPFYDIKEVWPKQKLEVDFTKPLKSNIRIMFLSGELDRRTSPLQAEEIKEGFNNSIHLVVKNAGHEQVLSNSEIRKAIPNFLLGKDVSKVSAAHWVVEFIPLERKDGTISHPSLND